MAAIQQNHSKPEIYIVTDYNPTQTTPFSVREKILARVWNLVWLLFYRPTPWFMYRYRVYLLNLFGAKISPTAHPSSSARIEYPWRLTMGHQASIGDRSWIYCLDEISIGENSCVGQGCQLITGSHNYKSKNFELVKQPIAIGKGCWLTSDVTVLMGIQIDDYAVIGTKALVTKSIPKNKVAFGNPAIIHSDRYRDH